MLIVTAAAMIAALPEMMSPLTRLAAKSHRRHFLLTASSTLSALSLLWSDSSLDEDSGSAMRVSIFDIRIDPFKFHAWEASLVDSGNSTARPAMQSLLCEVLLALTLRQTVPLSSVKRW